MKELKNTTQNNLLPPIHTELIEIYDSEKNNYIYLKDETSQYTGAFKYRGVYNKLTNTNLSNYNGVITASTGNHGHAVSFACNQINFPCFIVLPLNTPKNKSKKIKKQRATILQHKNLLTYDDCVSFAKSFAEDNNLLYIPSFDDNDIIRGHSSLFGEATEKHSYDYCFCQIGGGGLISAAITSNCLKGTKILGVEIENQDSMNHSLMMEKLSQVNIVENKESFCEGILVKEVGKIPFDIAQDYNLKVITVNEVDIKRAIKYLYSNYGIVTEGAGASGFSAYLKSQITNSNILCILSGKNIDKKIFNKIVKEV